MNACMIFSKLEHVNQSVASKLAESLFYLPTFGSRSITLVDDHLESGEVATKTFSRAVFDLAKVFLMVALPVVPAVGFLLKYCLRKNLSIRTYASLLRGELPTESIKTNQTALGLLPL
jgi:hypothetical protein